MSDEKEKMAHYNSCYCANHTYYSDCLDYQCQSFKGTENGNYNFFG